MDNEPDEDGWPGDMSEWDCISYAQADSRSPADKDESQKMYRVFCRNAPPPSALADACLESARVARSFYSIGVSYFRTPPGESTWPEQRSVMSLSPDWDILDVYSTDEDDAQKAEHIVEFFNDLRTADTAGKGALNLCLDRCQVKALVELNIPKLAAPVLQSYKYTVAGLRRLYWRILSADPGRIMAGWFYHTRTHPWHNVSMPLMADLSTVEFAGEDPRPTAPDLHQVWVGRDPRDIPALWARVERNLGVRAGSQGATTSDRRGGLHCRFLLASEPRRPIVDRASVDRQLACEVRSFCEILEDEVAGLALASMWRKALEKHTPELDTSSMNLEEILNSRVSNTAVGFWLIDPAHLGPVLDDNFNIYKTVIDMSELAIKPELCLFNLGG